MEAIGNLVVSRSPGEAICIGEDVTVTVVDVRGDKVRLAVRGPRSVEVDRAEVRGRKQRERQHTE